jgi:hypothetical protein
VNGSRYASRVRRKSLLGADDKPGFGGHAFGLNHPTHKELK